MASVRTLDESTMPAKLDATDWRILAELQKDGRITNVELASRVGLSAPPCLRRVRELERTGVIAGYHAIFNLPRLGFHLTAFAFVRLESQAEGDLLAFEARARQWEIVREAYMLSGDTDFLLKCVAPDLTRPLGPRWFSSSSSRCRRDDEPELPARCEFDDLRHS